MINAGELNNVIDVQQFYKSKQTDGSTIPTWRTFAQVFAKIENLKGKEREIYMQQDARSTHVITIRYMENLTEQHRFKHKDDTYGIVFIDNVEGMDFEHRIIVKRNAED